MWRTMGIDSWFTSRVRYIKSLAQSEDVFIRETSIFGLPV